MTDNTTHRILQLVVTAAPYKKRVNELMAYLLDVKTIVETAEVRTYTNLIPESESVTVHKVTVKTSANLFVVETDFVVDNTIAGIVKHCKKLDMLVDAVIKNHLSKIE